ncbi:MAG: hypothetical protein HQL56_12155 [Magnetococcales bacterium]|nr:hypothetical protein [Magnetococcales bacterium]
MRRFILILFLAALGLVATLFGLGQWRDGWIVPALLGEGKESFKTRLDALEETLKRQQSAQSQASREEVSSLKAELAALREELNSRPKPPERKIPIPRLLSGRMEILKSHPDWQLTDILARERTLKQRIPFDPPFAGPPKVMLSLTSLEHSGADLYLTTTAEEIGPDGFTLVVRNRSESRLPRVTLDWLALGS